MSKLIPFTKEEADYVQSHHLKKPIKAIARDLGIGQTRLRNYLKRNNIIIPKEVIERNKRESHLKSGHTPFNKGKKQKEYMSTESIAKTAKTRFKKGNLPHNTRYDGAERITKDGYVEIRLKKGVFRLKHLHEWEKINGKLPEGHCLKCQDGNRLNTEPSNWKLITRIENMYNNSFINYPKEIIPSLVLTRKITKIIENGTK